MDQMTDILNLPLGRLMRMNKQYEKHLEYIRAYNKRMYADPDKRAIIRQKQHEAYIRRREARLKEEEAKPVATDPTTKQRGRPKGSFTVPRTVADKN